MTPSLIFVEPIGSHERVPITSIGTYLVDYMLGNMAARNHYIFWTIFSFDIHKDIYMTFRFHVFGVPPYQPKIGWLLIGLYLNGPRFVAFLVCHQEICASRAS